MAAVNLIKHLLVERIYDDQTSYEAGPFNYHKDEAQGVYSSFPQLPTQPTPQKAYRIVGSGENSKEIEEERVLRKVIPGIDGRRRVEDTSKYPYSMHVQIEMKFPGGSTYGGSGSMVGPHHVLTCAHNVYDIAKKCWALKIDIYPGRNRESAPFGKSSATRAYVFEDWTNKEDKQFDIALLVLDQSIGFLTGWGGVCSSNNKSFVNEKFHITGYPSDRGLDEMWSMNHVIKQIHPETFDYEIDTASGQSGSAIWSDRWGQPTIIGVHTLGANLCNSGIRITEDKFTQLFTVIPSTYKKQEDVAISGGKQTTSIFDQSFSLIDVMQRWHLREVFGKSKWEKYFGDIGKEPPLPSCIDQILESFCPFWPEKKVRETHRLILIPNSIDDKPFDLKSLENLPRKQKTNGFNGHRVGTRLSRIGSISPHLITKEDTEKSYPSYWALITVNSIFGTKERTERLQDIMKKISKAETCLDKKLVFESCFEENHIPYSLPRTLELCTLLITEYIQGETNLHVTREFLSGDLDKNQSPLTIKSSGSTDIFKINSYYNFKMSVRSHLPPFGFVCVRRLS